MSRWTHYICVGDRCKKSPEKVGNEPHLPVILSGTVKREDDLQAQERFLYRQALNGKFSTLVFPLAVGW